MPDPGKQDYHGISGAYDSAESGYDCGGAAVRGAEASFARRTRKAQGENP